MYGETDAFTPFKHPARMHLTSWFGSQRSDSCVIKSLSLSVYFSMSLSVLQIKWSGGLTHIS